MPCQSPASSRPVHTRTVAVKSVTQAISDGVESSAWVSFCCRFFFRSFAAPRGGGTFCPELFSRRDVRSVLCLFFLFLHPTTFLGVM